MNIVRHRKIFYAISIVLTIASIAAVAIWGMNFGIDFKGGTILEISYKDVRSEISVIENVLVSQNINEGASTRPTGDKGYIVRTKALGEPEREQLVKTLGITPGFEVRRFDSVGPVLGQELRGKAVTSIVLVLFAIVLFITFVFRKVSEPVSSFKYGLIAIVALLHDIIVPVGAFAAFGHFYGTEIDSLFVTALLVILGFSIHDSIVVFDRVREHLKVQKELKEKGNTEEKSFEEIVDESIDETFTRSINTSLTTLLSLVALYFFGPEATQNFALALFIGIAIGTYSSIFLGSPLLVTVQKWQEARKLKKANK